MILPLDWYHDVKPGWIIEHVFDNNELNELKTQSPLLHWRIRNAHMMALSEAVIVRNIWFWLEVPPSGLAAWSVSPGPSSSPSAEGKGARHRRGRELGKNRVGWLRQLTEKTRLPHRYIDKATMTPLPDILLPVYNLASTALSGHRSFNFVEPRRAGTSLPRLPPSTTFSTNGPK
jgi:hypothetical protein